MTKTAMLPVQVTHRGAVVRCIISILLKNTIQRHSVVVLLPYAPSFPLGVGTANYCVLGSERVVHNRDRLFIGIIIIIGLHSELGGNAVNESFAIIHYRLIK